MSFNYYLFSYWSLNASLSTSSSRSITGPIVFLLDTNKPVTVSKQTSDTVGPGAGAASGGAGAPSEQRSKSGSAVRQSGFPQTCVKMNLRSITKEKKGTK